jgi:tetratricopeptide (TPR) repeat protein
MRHLREFHDSLVALPSVIAIDALVPGGIEAVPDAVYRALERDQVGGAMEEAESWYRESAGEDRKSAAISYALLLEGTDLLDDAMKIVDEERERSDSLEMRLVEAEVSLERGELEEAEELLGAVTPPKSGSGDVEPSVWGFAGDLLLDLERDEAALELYEAAVSGGTDNFETIIRLAEMQRDRGNWRRAAECYERAAEVGGDVIGPWERAAECWREAGQLSRSLEARAEVLDRRSGDAETWAKQGVGLRHVGKTDQAIEALEKATNLAPNRPEYWIELAHTHRQMGRSDRAIDGYKKVLDSEGSFMEALVGLASAALDQGDLALAEETAREAVETDDSHPEAWYLLARARRRGESLEGAEEAVRRALELDGGEARYHSLLGEILLDDGRSEEGFEALERAVDASPESAEIVIPFAVALLRGSDYGKLRELLEAEADWSEAPEWQLVAPVFEIIVDGIEDGEAEVDPVVERFEEAAERHDEVVPVDADFDELSRYALVLEDRRQAIVEAMIDVLEGRADLESVAPAGGH